MDKRALENVRQRLQAYTAERRPWPELLCREAEELLARIRETEPDFER
jgi:hypothetical protein